MAFLNGIQVFYNLDGVEGDSELFKIVRECSNIMAKPFPVTVHSFTSATPLSCAYERGDPSSRNALVFLGGLTSGPHTSPQAEPLVEALQAHPELNYSFWEFRMRSSYTGFGFSSLANDAEDLAALVTYLKSIGKEKVVLLGSSTGCQDIVTYSSNENYPSVAAYILSSPTSDRETASLLMPPDFLAQTLAHAESMIAKGDKDEAMPKSLIPPIFSSPITAYRWHSLIAPGGDDDFFSSDLDDAVLKTKFAELRIPTLMMVSEKDEMVPKTVDKRALLERWMNAASGCVRELSGVNPGADHEVSAIEPREWMVERVIGLLGSL